MDLDRLAAARKQFPGARFYQDWRVLLDKEADHLDSVNIGTPDHMHAPIAMGAMLLGKHVYGQKPLAHDLHEVRRMTEAALIGHKGTVPLRGSLLTQGGIGININIRIMRRGRWIIDPRRESPKPVIYHCVNRVVERGFVFGDVEREKQRMYMRMYENFSGNRVLAYCFMSNHFHVMLEVTAMPAGGLSDAELLERLGAIQSDAQVAEVAAELQEARERIGKGCGPTMWPGSTGGFC